MRGLVVVALLSSILAASTARAEQASAELEAERLYLERLVEGHRLFANNQHDAALRAYTSALEARRDDAFATYLVACTQRAAGTLDEALATMRRAATLAGADDALEARALFNVGLIQEARRDLAAAREAWRAYIAFAESHEGLRTYVANARQRLDVITAVEELNAAYEPVRQRIAAGVPGPGASN
jgi:tetratricopeptide (TPR) repeat protein